MSSFNKDSSTSNNLDHLFLQTLISRLQIRPPNSPLNPRTLDDLLLDAISNLSDDDDDDELHHFDNNRRNKSNEDSDNFSSHKTHLAKEESKLEKQLIRLIRAGDLQKLKPNSGDTVSIGEHHICVGNRVESGSDYKVWEWHGHIMLFDEDNGYTPEYIYGNYFERLPVKHNKEKNKEKEEKVVVEEEEVEEKVVEKAPVNLGLKELIGGGESAAGRVVHRGLNPAR